jgi:RHS repeat-associated protein
LTDALGSSVALAGTSGTVLTEYTYDPFGITTVSGAPTASATQFTGREYAGAELYFNRARFYSPRFQRFLSEDPLGHAGGINLFAYADNRPTLLTDPLGLKPRPGGDGPRIGPAPGPFIGPAPREPCSGGPAPVRYAGGIYDPGAGIGPAEGQPGCQSGGRIVFGGVGVSVGHNWNAGVMIGPNPGSTLTGPGLTLGVQLTPSRGFAAAFPLLGGRLRQARRLGVIGVSATLTWGHCF